jgi:hypothetical protein
LLSPRFKSPFSVEDVEDERGEAIEDPEELDSGLSKETEGSRCCTSDVEMFSSVPVVAVVDSC